MPPSRISPVAPAALEARTAFTPGKIILSGEYAVVFGYPGVAVPATVGVHVTWEDSKTAPMEIILEGLKGEETYARKIVDVCIQKGGISTGTLTIRNDIPVGRGMGSSTALIIGICHCLLGETNKAQAILVEEIINPGNSGLDFAVIWANHPVKFKRGSAPELVYFSLEFLKKHAKLIDTGKPGETTAELVAWMRSREEEVKPHLEIIGKCTERLLAGEDPKTVIRDHHRAQIALGVIPDAVQKLIAEVEGGGGAAKVLGAGARSGGGGMVLALE